MTDSRERELLREALSRLDEQHRVGDMLADRIRSFLLSQPPAQAGSERDDALELPAQVVVMCKRRGWSMHWTHRGAYLHLESSELIEAIRGKRGDPLKEAADVLLVLMSITEYAGISWASVVAQAQSKCDELMTKPHYPGEEFQSLPSPSADPAQPEQGWVREIADKMDSDHVISGSPGPLFSAGWSAACQVWAKNLRAALSDSTKDKNRLISTTEVGKSIKDGLIEGLLKDGK